LGTTPDIKNAAIGIRNKMQRAFSIIGVSFKLKAK
jgi:hypothetical protein